MAVFNGIKILDLWKSKWRQMAFTLLWSYQCSVLAEYLYIYSFSVYPAPHVLRIKFSRNQNTLKIEFESFFKYIFSPWKNLPFVFETKMLNCFQVTIVSLTSVMSQLFTSKLGIIYIQFSIFIQKLMFWEASCHSSLPLF